MTDAGDRGVIRRPGEARTIEVGGFTVVVHADADVTDGAFSLIETGDTEIGSGPPLHIHRDVAESFFVIDGAYVMVVGTREVRCEAGSFIHVPRGLPHTFRVDAPESRKLNLYTPAGMVGYFDDLAAGIRAGLGPERLDAIAERYAMDVVGAIPEGYLSADP